FSKGRLLYNFANARAAALQNGTIILAEGYMDVIALARAGFTHSVAPLGTALTEDQLALLWRTAPEPILAFDGDEAGLRAAQRAARLALPHLKPGYSLRFAFLPPGEDPDSLIRAGGPAAMKTLLDAAEPLSKVLWRVETEGKEFSTPERRAGLERALSEIVSVISDSKIADYYRREFEQKVFDEFKRRTPPARPEYVRPRLRSSEGRRWGALPVRPLETVSPAVKNSLLAKAGNSGARHRKEMELALMLLSAPQLAVLQGEEVAALPFSDRQLDRFRHELLNLAATGSRLEKRVLENHLIRAGLGDLLDRLGPHSPQGHGESSRDGDNRSGQGDADADMEARWLLAAAQLHEMAEAAPERRRAVERFTAEASEESWREAHRLLKPRAIPNE
ncbi:MAG TPA: toprim domain-containing protein, partial [Rhizomicrobium sp.]|nr:toprim domain-containing protein [Rhizomicrobium sp.]